MTILASRFTRQAGMPRAALSRWPSGIAGEESGGTCHLPSTAVSQRGRHKWEWSSVNARIAVCLSKGPRSSVTHCGRKTTTTSMRQRAAALLANPGRYLVAAGAGALMLGALWPWGRLGPPGRWFSWPNGAAIATGTIGLALACIARLHQGSPGKAYSPISVVLSIAAMLIGGPFLLQVIRLANRDPLITFSRGGYTTAAGIVLILVGGLLRTRAENGSSNARRAEVDPADAAEQVMDG